MEKISVSEFLNDNSLLVANYTPYELKVLVVDSILSQFKKDKVDSVLLKRVSTQVFIESITNLDLNIKNENDLNGYDLLCLNNTLDLLISTISDEYSRFEDILNLRLNDIYKYDSNMIKILFDQVMEYISDTIKTMDVEQITNKFKEIVSTNLENFKEVE